MKYTTAIDKEFNENKKEYYKIIKIMFEENEQEIKNIFLKDICKVGKDSNIISETENCVHIGFYEEVGFNNFREKKQIYQTKKFMEEQKIDISQIKLVPYEALVLPGNRKSTINFFDENGILHAIPIQDSQGIVNGVDQSGRINTRHRESSKIEMFGNNNITLISYALKKLKPGDNFPKFLEECEKISCEELPKTYSSEIERFVGRIDRIQIEREIDNLNKNTFDFIRAYIYLNKLDDSNTNIKEKVKKYLPDIISMTLDKIKNYKYYQRYGVPVEFLKLSKATLSKDACLELIFELKEFSLGENKYKETEEHSKGRSK